MRAAILLATVFSLAIARPALAQHPLCPAPRPDEKYYYYCGAHSQELLEDFLYDFSVSQLFKSPDGTELPTSKILEAMGLKTLLFPNDADRLRLLDERPSVEFHPLDRFGEDMSGRGYSSSGEFISKSSDGPQILKSVDPISGATIEVELPPVVQGIYWRSPAHLELQFYASHGIRFSITGAGMEPYKDTMQCISISRTAVRATTGDPSHPSLLSRFGVCN